MAGFAQSRMQHSPKADFFQSLQELNMQIKPVNFVAAIITGMCVGGAFAQSLDTAVQRDINQEKRIEQGLQSGSLDTREASLLQRDEARVDRLEARSLKDGKLSYAERQRIQSAENRASKDIYTAKHNGVSGNPLSASSQRMQADVQRDINQQQRIKNGIDNGSLNNREVARLEHGQARDDARQYRAGRDGHVGAFEQRRVQAAENRQSQRIYKLKHNDHVRKT
jgi:hypothetical protein